jgi:hypothetical protein
VPSHLAISCVMNTHRNNLAALSAAELRQRRDQLVTGLPRAAAFLAGSLVEQRRRCGKEGCRCARGELHGPYAYLSVAGRMIYVPAVLADAVRAHLQIAKRLQETLEEISAVNLELLSRRELD